MTTIEHEAAVDYDSPLGLRIAELQDALHDAEMELREANSDLDRISAENEGLEKLNDALEMRLEHDETITDVLNTLASWHDGEHTDPRHFCQQEPCNTLRLLTGYTHRRPHIYSS